MANNVGQDIKKAVTNVFETMKTSLKAIIGIVKLVAKLIGQLVGAGPPGWVVLLVIVAVVILIIVLYAFLGSEAVEKNSTTNATNGHDKYDAQEMINDATFADRKDTQKEMNDLRKQLKEDLKPEELQGIEDGLQELSDKLATYTSHHFASYDTNAGYQALSNEVNILLMLERLTYAYTFTDWEPDYIGIKNVEDKIAELKEELEKEKSESKKLDLEEDIKKLENTLEQLELKYNKFLELNREYKKKYKKDFIDSDKKSKISPDGRPLETKVISYFKSKYGEDLSETMEELSYFHTIIKRQFIYSKSFTGLSDCSKIEEWLKDPTYTEDELVSETNTWQSLAAIEEVYRVNWELMHHEAVLKQIMYYDTIGNNVLTDSVALEQLKKALSSHMPIFNM